MAQGGFNKGVANGAVVRHLQIVVQERELKVLEAENSLRMHWENLVTTIGKPLPLSPLEDNLEADLTPPLEFDKELERMLDASPELAHAELFVKFDRIKVQREQVEPIPNLTIVAVIVMVAVWVLLEQTTIGRRLYAIGGNVEAAYLSGVPVRRLKLLAFSLTGLSAAGAGLLYASRVASANPTQGSGLMLNAIAAVFLGMTMSEQGEPRILATLIGVLILGVLDNGLTQMSVDSYVRQILVGAIIVVAVAASSITKSARR
jgi:ABC-type glucose/galactose transport system permease subunit